MLTRWVDHYCFSYRDVIFYKTLLQELKTVLKLVNFIKTSPLKFC